MLGIVNMVWASILYIDTQDPLGSSLDIVQHLRCNRYLLGSDSEPFKYKGLGLRFRFRPQT